MDLRKEIRIVRASTIMPSCAMHTSDLLDKVPLANCVIIIVEEDEVSGVTLIGPPVVIGTAAEGCVSSSHAHFRLKLFNVGMPMVALHFSLRSGSK